MKLGLDELIIVNPGTPPPAATWLLGADGGLYRLDGREASPGVNQSRNGAALGSAEPVPRYFLGDDGILYETR